METRELMKSVNEANAAQAEEKIRRKEAEKEEDKRIEMYLRSVVAQTERKNE